MCDHCKVFVQKCQRNHGCHCQKCVELTGPSEMPRVRNNVASALCQMLTLYCRNLRQIQIAFGNHKSIEIIFLLRFPCKSCWGTPPSLRLIAVRALFKWKTVALQHHGGLLSSAYLPSFLTNRKVPHLVMMMMSRGGAPTFSLWRMGLGHSQLALTIQRQAASPWLQFPDTPIRQLNLVFAKMIGMW